MYLCNNIDVLGNKKDKKTAIIIAGPTAIGKTSIAINLAQHFNTEIISSDSRQCYKEMTIATAVPSQEELAAVPHHFIHSHSIHQEMNAGKYEAYALNKAKEIFEKKDVVILCGGTGLYIKAFCEGIDDIPPVKKEIQEQIQKEYITDGLETLQKQLKELDYATFNHIDIQNSQRVMRALAVKISSGHSILEFQKEQPKERPFNISKIALTLPREQLWERIEKRITEMTKAGLEEEARKLYQYKSFNALQTTGYQEIFDYIDGKYTFEEALEQIYIHTRQYAKRQKTWFKKDKQYKWFSPFECENIISYLENKLNSK